MTKPGWMQGLGSVGFRYCFRVWRPFISPAQGLSRWGGTHCPPGFLLDVQTVGTKYSCIESLFLTWGSRKRWSILSVCWPPKFPAGHHFWSSKSQRDKFSRTGSDLIWMLAITGGPWKNAQDIIWSTHGPCGFAAMDRILGPCTLDPWHCWFLNIYKDHTNEALKYIINQLQTKGSLSKSLRLTVNCPQPKTPKKPETPLDKNTVANYCPETPVEEGAIREGRPNETNHLHCLAEENSRRKGAAKSPCLFLYFSFLYTHPIPARRLRAASNIFIYNKCTITKHWNG